MAKRKSRTAKGAQGRDDDKDIYVFLIKNTALGSTDNVKWEQGAFAVTKKIRDLGGDCTFYLTTGETYDGVSIVTGLSLRDAVEVSREINSFGTVTGTRLSGIRMTK